MDFLTLAHALAHQCEQLTSRQAESPLNGADHHRARLATYLAPIRRIPMVTRVDADLGRYRTSGHLRLILTVMHDDNVRETQLLVTVRPHLADPQGHGLLVSAHWQRLIPRVGNAWHHETRQHVLALADHALRQPPRLTDGHLRVVPQ